MRRLILILAASSAMMPFAASAQNDVIVMRRVVAKPTRSITPPATPTPGTPTPGTPTPGTPTPGTSDGYYNWNVTAWTQTGTCGQISPETRGVTCQQADGTVVADSFCYGDNSGPRPVDTLTVVNTDSCSFSWKTSDWDAPATACGATQVTRDVTCVRSDGAVMADSACSGSKPPSTDIQTITGGCSYGWNVTGWSVPDVTSCTQATVTRTVTCQRSDGAVVGDALCTGAKPDASEQVYTCGEGVAWHVGDWGAPVPGCGNTVQTRTVTCQDTGGSTYADSVCTGAKPDASEPAKDYSTCTDGRTAANPYGWAVGAYGPATPACGPTVDTRSVVCTDDSGNAVADSQCLATKPSTTRPDNDHSACTYSWYTGDYGAPQPACGPTSSYRTVACQRSDGTNVDGSFCQGSQPAATQPATDYSACTFGWSAGAWSAPSATCGNATETRTVTCQRADGTSVDDSQCASAGAKPPATQSSYETSGCGLSWSTGDWTPTPACGATTETRTVTCQRSDGQTVDDSQCAVVGANPPTSQDGTDYSACTFDWAVGAYTGPTTTCGTVTQTRNVYCQRSDQTVADDASCTKTRPPSSQQVTDTSTCSYAWVPEAWGAAAPACGDSVQTRTIDCRRSDGTNVDGSFCSATPNTYATSQAATDYSTCTYIWQADAWNGTAGCGASVTQTRNVYCLRSNNDHVADSFCSGTKIPSSQTITDYSACTYYWQQTTGPWSGGTCSSTATRNNVVTCMRSDGNPAPNDSYCDTGTKPSTKDTGDYEGCTYTGTYGSFGTCKAGVTGSTSGTQTATLSSCKRSDNTDVTAENASKNYTECAQTKSQSCTVVYTPTWSSNYGACGNTDKTATTGTQSESLVSCTDPDGGTAPNFACDGYTAPSQSCTFTFTPTYGTYSVCSGGKQTASITACKRSDGVSVATSMCPATDTRDCSNLVTNGDFDAGNLNGWTASNFGLATPGVNGTPYAAASTSNAGTLKQSISTTAGKSYLLTISCFGSQTQPVVVYWNGNYAISKCGVTGATKGWTTQTVAVTGKTNSTTSDINIQLYAGSPVDVDSISVVPN